MASAMKAIREKCLNCVCDQPKEIRLCPSVNCPLYDFRMGKYIPKSQDDTQAKK